MIPVAPPIGVADVPGGYLVNLPPQLALVLSLRRAFRKVRAAAEPWTYFVPGPAKRLGEWLAEVELRALTERRRRAWSANDAEWACAIAPAPAAEATAAVPSIISLPKKRTARPLLELLQHLAAGEILIAESGRFHLHPSGRTAPAGVARRAIEQRLIVPNCDGLFGPDCSQSWRAPKQEETDAAAERSGPGRPEAGAEGKADRPSAVRSSAARRPRRSMPTGLQGAPVADRSRRAVPRRSRGVEAEAAR